jgi:DNA modification methylase
MRDFVNKIYNSDNLELIKKLPDMSVSGIISDIPYALCDIDAIDMIKNNSNNSGDFMNKKWILPTVEMLKEFYRVLKTGGFMVTTFTPRQDLQTVLLYRLMEAGFDVSFSPIYWAYKSGFPKASNYNKTMRKHGYDNEAIYCDGLYSLSAKPAVEPIIICQKPHGKAKYKQALNWYYERKELLDKGIPEEDLSLYTKNSSGGVFFDNTRIPCKDEKDENSQARPNCIGKQYGGQNDGAFLNEIVKNQGCNKQPLTQGRFPANLLCGFPISKEELRSEYPEATEEELDKMVSMIENPLDVGRSFISKWGKKTSITTTPYIPNCGNKAEKINGDFYDPYLNDQGDLSRYFSLTAWSKKHFPNLHNIAEKTLQLQDDVKKTGDCLFVCKTSVSEKNAGLDGFECGEPPASARSKPAEGRENALGKPRQNTHPTTKPIALYNYLITLFSKEGDIILDPFCGSGVTPIACVLTNRKYIGIDISQEYCAIANARVEYWKQQKEGVKNPSASKKNISASTGKNEVKEKQDIQGSLL